MKHLKTALTVSGALAILAVFLPYFTKGDESMSYWDFHKLPSGITQGILNGPKQVYVALVCFLVPTLVGLVAIATKQLQRWMAILATVFSLLAFSCEGVRKALSGMYGESTAFGGKLIFIAALSALVVSIVGIVKPEKAPRI